MKTKLQPFLVTQGPSPINELLPREIHTSLPKEK